jgi:hypothetical protein
MCFALHGLWIRGFIHVLRNIGLSFPSVWSALDPMLYVLIIHVNYAVLSIIISCTISEDNNKLYRIQSIIGTISCECGRSWVWATIGSNQRLWKWYVLPLGIRIMCQEWSDISIRGLLFHWASTMQIHWTCWSRTKQTSSSSHCNVTCSRHDIAEILLKVALSTKNLKKINT